MFRKLVRGLNGDVVKRDISDGGNAADDISNLRSSMEIMMENVNHLVTKQQVGQLNYSVVMPGFLHQLNILHFCFLLLVCR
jgi:hypothetical protein